MGTYMYEVSYTQSGIQGVVKEGGSSRANFIGKLIEGAGGTMRSFHFAFGDRDVIIIADFPDHASAASIPIAASASGAVSVKTTVLLDPETIDAAAQRDTGYRPPGSS